LCGLLHTQTDPEEPGYRRGYLIASLMITIILVVELIVIAGVA
jgi:hypothetical protein